MRQTGTVKLMRVAEAEATARLQGMMAGERPRRQGLTLAAEGGAQDVLRAGGQLERGGAAVTWARRAIAGAGVGGELMVVRG